MGEMSSFLATGLVIWSREGGNMANTDFNEILGLIDSNKGEIICRECIKEEDLPHIPEEEVITQEKIQGDEKYICNRCNKQL